MILNVKCLEYSSPSKARSVLSHDSLNKWAKGKSMSMLIPFCDGQMKDSPGAKASWEGQVEGLGLCSSFQEVVGSTKIRPDGDDSWRTITPLAGYTPFLDLLLNPKSWQLFPKAHSLDQFWKFKL